MGVLLFWAGRSEVDRFLGMEEARGSNPRQSIGSKSCGFRENMPTDFAHILMGFSNNPSCFNHPVILLSFNFFLLRVVREGLSL